MTEITGPEREHHPPRFKYTSILGPMDYTALSWEPEPGDIWHTLTTLAELGREPIAFTKVGPGWDQYVGLWSGPGGHPACQHCAHPASQHYATTTYRDGALTETALRDHKGALNEYDEQIKSLEVANE